MNSEVKSEANDLAEAIAKALNINISTGVISKTLKEFYDKGLLEMELRFDMNFSRDETRLNTLKEFVMENIKGLNDEMQQKIRKEVVQGVMNLESVTKIQGRIRNVVDMTKDRARMIARTEANRALNMAHMDAARQSGLKIEKEWIAAIDARTSPVCRHLNGKRIPLDKKFKYNDKEFDMPPAHPNCRSRLIYVQV